MGKQSNVNMTTESSYTTSYLMVIAMYAISATTRDIHDRNAHDIDHVLQNALRSYVLMLEESQNITFYLMETVMSDLFLAIDDIFA